MGQFLRPVTDEVNVLSDYTIYQQRAIYKIVIIIVNDEVQFAVSQCFLNYAYIDLKVF